MFTDPLGTAATRDVVFLFQYAYYTLHDIPMWATADPDDTSRWLVPSVEDVPEPLRGVVTTELDEFDRPLHHIKLSDAALRQMYKVDGSEYVCEHWHTDGVWAFEAEAHDFGSRHSYRWSNWRTFGVPADGALAAVLRRYPEEVVELPTGQGKSGLFVSPLGRYRRSDDSDQSCVFEPWPSLCTMATEIVRMFFSGGKESGDNESFVVENMTPWTHAARLCRQARKHVQDLWAERAKRPPAAVD